MNLTELIGTVSNETFFAEHWEKAYLYVEERRRKHSVGHFASRPLFSIQEADRILSAPGPHFRDFARLTLSGREIPSYQFVKERPDGLVDYRVDTILELYGLGATITLNRVQQWSPSLADLCDMLGRDFQAHTNVNAYISPANNQGFKAHADTHDVFILQISGRKRWRLQKRLQHLATNRVPNRDRDAFFAGQWDEIVVNPGDVLYLPRGLFHEGIADGSHSLHLTVGVHTFTWIDLIHSAVDKLELSSAVGRSSVSAATGCITTKKEMIADLAKLVSAEHEAFSYGGAGHYQRSLGGELTRIAEEVKVGVDDRLQLLPEVQIAVRQVGREVELLYGTKALSFPDYVAQALNRILQGAPFSAPDIPGPLDDEGKLVLLNRLVAEGIVEIVR